MDPYTLNGRSVLPRRLPPVPSLPSLRTSTSSFSSSSSSSPDASPHSSLSLSPGSSSEGLSSPDYSPSKTLSSLKRSSRPLPQIPLPPGRTNIQQQQSTTGQNIVCKNCMNSIATSGGLLPSSAVPPGSRSFRGFSGKAALFTQVRNITVARPRVQLMTTGAHTMQEAFCAQCQVYVGWKIVKAHERSERWKEGTWLLELEGLRVTPNETSTVDPEESNIGVHRSVRTSVIRAPRGSYPKDAMNMVKSAREKGLGLDLGSVQTNYGHHYHTSHSDMRTYHASASAVYLPVRIAAT